MLVCARIGHNPDNNEYGAECAKKYPDRLIQFADVDCSWSDTYHVTGAAERLAEAVLGFGLPAGAVAHDLPAVPGVPCARTAPSHTEG